MASSAHFAEKVSEFEDLKATDTKIWAFTERNDSSSSGSSDPDDIDLILGEINVIQRNKLLGEEDQIDPLTAIHKIKVSDKWRKVLTKCNSVSTDWALELESSFLSGSRLLVREILPGSEFSFCYEKQGAYDVVVIRAHLTAKSGNNVFDGYYCRRQKLSCSLDFKKLGPIPKKTFAEAYFEKLKKDSTDSAAPWNEQLKGGGDFGKNNVTRHRPLSSNGSGTEDPHGNKGLHSERIPRLSTASVDNEPILETGESTTFNESSKMKTAKSSKTTAQRCSEVNKQPPDGGWPGQIPKAVLDVSNYEEFLANKKVIAYLDTLDKEAAKIGNRFENHLEVNKEDISTLNSATSAILREYGYDYPTTESIRRSTERKSNSNADTTSESDVSDSEIKSELVKRTLEGGDLSELLDSLKDSKEWKESVKDDWRSGSELFGKIERKIRHNRSQSSQSGVEVRSRKPS